jgi:O-antigen ligase
MVEKPLHSTAPRSVSWRPRRVSQFAHLLLLLGAAAAVFLAGGPPEGNLGVFLLVAGVALLVFPPQVRVDGKFWLITTLLLLCASTAFLPYDWFPIPAWRQKLASSAFAFPTSITPVPRETCFWLAVLTITAALGLFGLAHPMSSKAQLILASIAVAICGVYAGLSIYVRQSGWMYPFDPDPETFGLFPNKNHTATFLVIGSVLALGILGVAFRQRHWFAGSLAAIGLAVCVTSLIFFSTSRGGIVSLVVGVLLWFIGLGAAHRSKPLLVSFAAIFMGAVLLFLAPGSVVRERLQTLTALMKDRVVTNAEAPVGADDAPLDGRVPIFTDTLHLLRDFPFTGTGLGTFRYVFPFYREQSLWAAPVIHPESDWLMLAAEAGLPALGILGVGIACLIGRVWRWRDHPYWPLRWGILCAALAALAHGFVDVPAHRTALGWWILVLCGIGFQTMPREPRPSPRGQHLLFILAGLGACFLGIRLIRSDWFGGDALPPFAGNRAQPEIIGLRVGGDLPEAAAAAREAIRRSPMTERLYYQLAVTLLQLRAPEAEVDSAFRAQRLVNPDPQVAVDQGLRWMKTAPGKTAVLWLEAIQTRVGADRTQGAGKGSALSLYRDLLVKAGGSSELQRALLAASQYGREFTFAWLEQAAPALVTEELPRLGADDAFSSALTETERRRFLQIWYQRGAREALFQWLGSHPEWEAAAWPIAIRRLVDAGNFAEAVQSVSTHYKIDLTLPEPDVGKPETTNIVPDKPAAAFSNYWRKGNIITARRILDEARAGRPPIEPEIWRLSAALSARDTQWQSAWQCLEQYLRESHLDSWP